MVALTGTDLYGDIETSAEARATLDRADRLVVLQELGLRQLPAHVADRGRVITQSAQAPPPGPPPDPTAFEVALLAHLREVKDPFLAAAAVGLLQASSRIRVVHLGAGRAPGMEERARAESARNPRYRWRGGVAHEEALRTLARCRLLVLTSRLEGGANVVTEAIACSVPVLSTEVAGSVGLLGEDYPGYFPVGDTAALAALLERAETDTAFLGELGERGQAMRHLIDPAEERRRWAALVAELS